MIMEVEQTLGKDSNFDKMIDKMIESNLDRLDPYDYGR